jgi:hypothetical protein
MHKRWLLLSVLLLVTLSSCSSVDEEVTPERTATFTPTNTPTPTPTNTPTNTPTPTATQIPCFTLIGPEDGAEFGAMGLITFEWTDQFGATQYQIEITFPSGVVESKLVEETTYERWLESLPPGGEYEWRVVAMDEGGEVICSGGPHFFTKPEKAMKSPGNGPGGSPGTGDQPGGGSTDDQPGGGT